MECRHVRPDLDRPLDQLGSLGRAALGVDQHAQEVQRIGVGGVLGEHAAIKRLGCVGAAGGLMG